MRKARSFGFTLVELMIAVALVSVVILAATIVLLDQERLFRQNEDQRAGDDSARLAADTLTQAITSAGFGMDPNLAVDFQYYNCANNSDGTGIIKTAACSALTRESNAAPDELVVYSRNPDYRVPLTAGAVSVGLTWSTNAVSAGSITLSANSANFAFPKGQILLVSCTGGQTYTYVTVDTTTAAGATTVALDTTGSDPFHQQTVLSSNACFASGASVFLIDRKRFFIAPYKGHPYLMMDPGIDLNGDGNIDANDVSPVAADVEDMQVAYAMNPPTAGGPLDAVGNSDSVLFDVAGESALVPQDGNQTTPCSDITVPYYANRCFFERTSTDPLRFTNDPANIISIQVSLVVRSDRPDQNLANAQIDGTLPALMDRPAVDLTASNYNGEYTSVGRQNYGYRRSTIQLAVSTPNLISRGLFLW